MKHDLKWMKFWALAAVFALAAPIAHAAEEDAPQITKGATEYMVAMRDGVKLATNVFLPEGDGPFPVVLTRTPYGKEGRFGAGFGRYTGAGFAFVVQDCRGKFRSEGEYFPFETDREDGFDTIEWIAEQAWCDSNIGMSGISAMGITSNLAASINPSALKAAFVVVAPHSMFNEATFINGVFKEADVGNWMRGQGAGDQVAARKASVVVDESWERDLPNHIDNIRIPMFNLGGWYDIFSLGNISNFEQLQKHGAKGARGNQKLMMGPYGHGNLAGDLQYRGAEQGLIGALGEELRWFDYWLKGEDNGIMDEPSVKYYMMAAARKGDFSEKNGWRTAENWPPETKELKLYLTTELEDNDNALALSTTPPSSKTAKSSYAFDPKDPVETIGGANLTLPLGPRDQRGIPERSDYLRFQTPVLTEDLAVLGRVQLDLWASTDAPDTDFMVKLVDVYPDGYEALILDCPIRARYREGRRAEDIKMMPAGEPVRMTVDLWRTANIFEKGHRLAVHISSSNFPRFETNPNTGDPAGHEMTEPRIANNAIYHNADHPTALVLQITN